jgi:hypothetical protein
MTADKTPAEPAPTGTIPSKRKPWQIRLSTAVLLMFTFGFLLNANLNVPDNFRDADEYSSNAWGWPIRVTRFIKKPEGDVWWIEPVSTHVAINTSVCLSLVMSVLLLSEAVQKRIRWRVHRPTFILLLLLSGLLLKANLIPTIVPEPGGGTTTVWCWPKGFFHEMIPSTGDDWWSGGFSSIGEVIVTDVLIGASILFNAAAVTEYLIRRRSKP